MGEHEEQEHSFEIERARWAVRLLARNQDTEQARLAAQRHLERLGTLMKTQMTKTTTNTRR